MGRILINSVVLQKIKAQIISNNSVNKCSNLNRTEDSGTLYLKRHGTSENFNELNEKSKPTSKQIGEFKQNFKNCLRGAAKNHNGADLVDLLKDNSSRNLQQAMISNEIIIADELHAID